MYRKEVSEYRPRGISLAKPDLTPQDIFAIQQRFVVQANAMPQQRGKTMTYPEQGVVNLYRPIKEGGHIDVVGYRDIPTGDWDLPDPAHKAYASDANAITSPSEAFERIEQYARDTNSRWRVYSTAGGIRAFDLTQQLTPEMLRDAQGFATLRPDEMYQKLMFEQNRGFPAEIRGEANRLGVNAMDPVYLARTSGKPGRPMDYIAEPIGTIGSGPINPRNVRLLETYHDRPILENRKAMNEGALGVATTGIYTDRANQIFDRIREARGSAAADKVMKRIAASSGIVGYRGEKIMPLS